MTKYDFLIYSDGIINDIDFNKYVKYLERSKIPPAFDALNLSAPENELFGDNAVLNKHFTFYSYQYSTFQSLLASPSTIKQMNPMYYIGNKGDGFVSSITEAFDERYILRVTGGNGCSAVPRELKKHK